MPRFLKEQKKTLVFAGLLFAQLVLISLQVPRGGEPTYFEKAIFLFFSPVQRAVHGLFHTAGSIWNRYLHLGRVEAQNRQLRDDLFEARRENVLLKNEVARLQDKREMERLLSAVHESFLVAEVIGMDAANIHKSIIIDKGSHHGLKSSMAVVDRFGNLVGRIVNPVSFREATVQLITDDNSSVAVQSETNKVIGLLSGDAKGKTCWLKYVLATNDEVIEGEELLTSGFDKIFPAGIRVGKILSITADSSLFKKIEVKPHLDFRELRQVAVLTRKTDELDFDEER